MSNRLRMTRAEKDALAEAIRGTLCYRESEESEEPTLDAVPVVRCRDCKHWCTDSTPCLRGVVDLHFCAVAGFDSTADWFCADGERKEE